MSGRDYKEGINSDEVSKHTVTGTTSNTSTTASYYYYYHPILPLYHIHYPSIALPVKRGPGRPRKYPRPGDHQPSIANTKPSPKRRAPVHHQQDSFTFTLSDLLPDKSNVSFWSNSREWMMLDHFTAIFNHLSSKRTAVTTVIDPQWFRPASHQERIEISKLPRNIGHLINLLNNKITRIHYYYSKEIWLFKSWKKEFNFMLTGPFGYIDINKISRPPVANGLWWVSAQTQNETWWFED